MLWDSEKAMAAPPFPSSLALSRYAAYRPPTFPTQPEGTVIVTGIVNGSPARYVPSTGTASACGCRGSGIGVGVGVGAGGGVAAGPPPMPGPLGRRVIWM